MAGQDSMRAADADRDVVAERLRVALGEGRLELHEYDERVQRVYAARTYGDLAAVTTDLPAPVPPERAGLAPVGAGAVQPDVAAAARGATAAWLGGIWLPYLRVVAIVVTIWAVTSLIAGDPLYFWPGWVAGPWGAVLLVRTVTGIALGEPARAAPWRGRQRRVGAGGKRHRQPAEQAREARDRRRAERGDGRRKLAEPGDEVG
jgi:hypothetical protein